MRPGSKAMGRLVAERQAQLHPDWVVHTTLKLPGLALISPGTELRIDGERGRVYRFIRMVETPRGSWIDVYGGTRDPNGDRAVRSFAPERIAHTYRKPQLRRRDPNS